jgi:hypothetical protein
MHPRLAAMGGPAAYQSLAISAIYALMKALLISPSRNRGDLQSWRSIAAKNQTG